MAETPWGDLRINDAHVHFFSRAFYEGLARQKKSGDADSLGSLLSWEIPVPDPAVLAHRWVAELDAQGAGRVCLIASSHGDEASVAAAVQAHPDRFYGFFMLDPLQNDAMERLTSAVSNPYLHCVCFFPAMHTYSIVDPRLIPMLELISDHHLAVFVHCGALSVGVRKKLGLPSQFDLRFSDPLNLHPVALHFPEIRFIVPHFGAGLLRETLMLADLCPNVYLDTSSTNHWMLYDALDLRSVFRRVLDLLGPERLLFGTDSSFFPRGWHRAVFEQQTKALYELGLDIKQATLIFKTNLEHVLEPRITYLRMTLS
jgi:predicted TIM-barrel fold metal-dependent hydrolase